MLFSEYHAYSPQLLAHNATICMIYLLLFLRTTGYRPQILLLWPQLQSISKVLLQSQLSFSSVSICPMFDSFKHQVSNFRFSLVTNFSPIWNTPTSVWFQLNFSLIITVQHQSNSCPILVQFLSDIIATSVQLLSNSFATSVQFQSNFCLILLKLQSNFSLISPHSNIISPTSVQLQSNFSQILVQLVSDFVRQSIQNQNNFSQISLDRQSNISAILV